MKRSDVKQEVADFWTAFTAGSLLSITIMFIVILVMSGGKC